jgi:hypothetical protein
MQKLLLSLLLALPAAFAADTAGNKQLLQDLEQKAKAISAIIPPAEKLLPADTLGFLTVPDWSRAQNTFSNSATGQLWSDPSMKGFKESFFEKFSADKIQPLEKELGFQFTNFLNLARGQFTLGVVPNGWDGRSERQPGVLWLIDVKENSSQLKTNLADLRKKWTENGRKMRTERIRDVEFTVVIVDAQEIGKSLQKLTPGPKAAPPVPEEDVVATRTVEWVIGQSGSLLLVSDAAKDVEKVLALQSGISVPSLADQASFAPSAGMMRDAQTFAWINVKPIMTTLARKPAERPPPDQQSMFGAMPTMEKVLNAFGLSGVQTIAFNVLQSPEGSTANVAVRVPEAGRKGLFNILAVDAKDASAPPFVPADAVKFSRWRIDLQKAWSTIENMLVEISPQYAGFSKLILDTAGKDRDPNFDFRKQLLANLGDDVISYDKAPRPGAAAAANPPPAPSLTLIGSKNAEQMAASLRAVTSIFPPEMIKYSERDFLGRKVYSVVVPQLAAESKPRPLTYAASGGYVAFSTDAATLEEYLRSGEGNVKPLRDLPGLNNAAQKVGGTGSGYFSFENQAEGARAAFDLAKKDPSAVTEVLGAGQLTTVFSMLGNDQTSASDLIDATKLPPFDRIAKFFHFDVSAISVTPEAITFKTFTPTPPALRK